jgi:kynureninase
MYSRADCAAMDRADPLAHARARFILPENLIYLDGNSLGALPANVAPTLERLITREWGRDLVSSWNAHDWIGMPARIGAWIAPLIGADDDEVIVADSTSVNLFKLAGAAIRHMAPRRVIVSERGNFPTDLYVLQGLERLLGGAAELRMVERDNIRDAVNAETALVALTHIHYKTGAIHDMRALGEVAHAAGALVLWDLSHSAGAVELFLNRDHADLAIGCGYKYLNGGPGAPAFLYVARRHQEALQQPLSGWMGHAAPFEFGDDYRPAGGILRQLCGTPPILSMAALAEGIATFDGIAMHDIREKSKVLGDLFLALVERRCPGFEIACARNAEERGSQVSLRHPHGYAIMRALIDKGVVGDFRAPDVLRFGLAPLYTRYVDIWDATDQLRAVMTEGAWRDERYRIQSTVT